MVGDQNSQDGTSLPSDAQAALLAEYATLRAEILKRIEIRYQLISVAIVAPGTLLAFALQTHSTALTLLYPVFAYFLSVAWSDNERSIRQMAEYIRNRIEARLEYIAWEQTVSASNKLQPRLGRWLNYQSARGIFLGTQLLTLFIGLALATPSRQELANFFGIAVHDYGLVVNVLLIVAIGSIIASVIALRRLPIMPIPPLPRGSR